MGNKFTISTNIIRDTEKDLHYIPTPNAIRICNQLSNDFKQGVRAFTIIGSYGTGKSSFLWALEQTLLGKKSFFGINIVANARVDFFKIIGDYRLLQDALAEFLDLAQGASEQTIFAEIFNKYYGLGKEGPLLVIAIDEFGKFLEYAAKNQPEKGLYFIQKLAEFVSDPQYNIVLITTLHQNIDAYAMQLDAADRQEWTKVKGRFREITFNEPVEQLLYLAAEHLVEKNSASKKQHEIQKLTDLLSESKVFRINEDTVNGIAQKLYPIDPIAAYVVTLSLQRYGQNERSLFSFLESTDHTGLYQHGVTKDSFYALPEVYDYLIYNYFSFLNSRYNPDFSAWKSIKSALDKVENTFSEGVAEYQQIIKVIGLLSIYGQPGAAIGYEFLEQYCKYSLAIEDESRYIEQLDTKNIIRYRKHNNRFVLFEGTDLDIESALYEAGNKIDEVTDVVTLLKKNYQLPLIVAKRALFETGTPRLFEYIISNEPISLKPVDETDGYVNLIFNDSKALKDLKAAASLSQEAILYCFYHNTREIKDLLFEVEKTRKVIEDNSDDKVAVSELKNILIHQQNLLNHRILNSLYGDKATVTWFFAGAEVPLRSAKEFNAFLSEICSIIYHKTPYFNNELVNKHKISASIHTAKRSYFKALANDWDMPDLGFALDKFPAEKTIYLSLLENNGIRLHDESSGEVRPDNRNGFEDLWQVSQEYLDSAKLGKRKVSEFVSLLSKRPFKLKKGFIEFWVPTYLFIKRDEFALFNEGIYTPILSEDILERIAKVPEDFEIKSFALEGVRLDLFNSYRKFLNINSEDKAGNQTFIETIKPFLVFYKGLPEYSKQTKRLSREAVAIRESIANSKDPEQSFFVDFPAALGYSVARLQKDRGELHHFIKQLQDAIKEVRNCYDELVGRFEAFIQEKFFSGTPDFEKYQQQFQLRYKNLHRHMLLNDQKSFVQRIDSQIDDKNAWLGSLAQSLTGRTLDKFRDEDEIKLYDRFEAMIVTLDSLTNLSQANFDDENEFVFDIRINSFGEAMNNKIVRLPKTKSSQVSELEKKVANLLSGDKNINLAAVSAVLKDLLKNE
jgi:hypothetical protein